MFVPHRRPEREAEDAHGAGDDASPALHSNPYHYLLSLLRAFSPQICPAPGFICCNAFLGDWHGSAPAEPGQHEEEPGRSFLQSHFSDMVDGRLGIAESGKMRAVHSHSQIVRGRVPSSETAPQQCGPRLSSLHILTQSHCQVPAEFPRVLSASADVDVRQKAESDVQPPSARQPSRPPLTHAPETPAAGQEGARIGKTQTPSAGILSALPDPQPHAPRPADISQTLLPSGLLGPPMSLPSPKVSQRGEEQHSWLDGLLDGSRDENRIHGGRANAFGSRVVVKWGSPKFESSEGKEAREGDVGSGGGSNSAGRDRGVGAREANKKGTVLHPAAQKVLNRVELWKRLHHEHGLQVRKKTWLQHCSSDAAL